MRIRALVRGSSLVFALALTAPLFAQPVPKTGEPQPPPPLPVQPQNEATLKGESTGAVPPEEEVVAPVPRPAKVLSNWREALALASAEDPEYSISLLEVDRVEGVHRQTLAGALPTIDARGTLTLNLVQSEVQTFDVGTGGFVNATIPSTLTAVASISARQPLIAPRIWWAIGTASEQVDLAKMNLQDQRRVLIASAADAIVTVVTAERQAEVNRVSYSAAQDRLKLMKKRKELGAGSALDVVRFQQDLVIARSSLVEGDETLRQTRERLGLVLGTPGEYGVMPNLKIDDIESTLTRACEKGDLIDRADIRALRQQVDISERAVTDADLMYAPSADVVSTFSYASEDLIGDKNYNFNIQGVLSVPIWDGGERYGARRSAIASFRQQEERLEAATRSATVEVSQAERAVGVAQQTLEIAEAARDLAKQTDELVRTSFAEGGDVTSFDLVDAARRLREAELTLTVRELELVRSKIAAMLATSNCPDFKN